MLVQNKLNDLYSHENTENDPEANARINRILVALMTNKSQKGRHRAIDALNEERKNTTPCTDL